MRLYLSSYRIGDRAGALLALLGNGKRAAIIDNARDGLVPAERERQRRDAHDPVAELASLGIAAEELDLRHYFGAPPALADRLAEFDLVWVTDGNPFTLRRAMRQSGFDSVIDDLLDRDAIVYGGSSAGAVVAAPSLLGLELMAVPDEQPPSYSPGVVWDGLGLIDHAIIPHYRSPHPDAAAAERAGKHFASRRVPFRALRDGEVIVRTGPRPVVAPQLRRTA